MPKFRFNRSALEATPSEIEVTQDEIMSASGLWRSSLQDALLYGGDAVQKALASLPLKGDREHVTVDVKIHMLMAGMIPAIPGWHTDGIPRASNGAPSGDLKPFCPNLEKFESPHFHLFIGGDCSPTRFLKDRDVMVEVPGEPTNDLYAVVNKNVKQMVENDVEYLDVEENMWYSWDWFELHKAMPAHKRGWRILIRVTESDFLQPKTDLREVLRTHQQAYLLAEDFGW